MRLWGLKSRRHLTAPQQTTNILPRVRFCTKRSMQATKISAVLRPASKGFLVRRPARFSDCEPLHNRSQKLNLSANCPTRAFTAVLVITPKVGDEKFESGFANCGWLKVLKNSARN